VDEYRYEPRSEMEWVGLSAEPYQAPPKPGTCSACKWWKDGHYKRMGGLSERLLPDGTCCNMVATLGAHIGTGRYATCKHHEPTSASKA
jgi:hypothetical protein